jgi:hypothetical protein
MPAGRPAIAFASIRPRALPLMDSTVPTRRQAEGGFSPFFYLSLTINALSPSL